VKSQLSHGVSSSLAQKVVCVSKCGHTVAPRSDLNRINYYYPNDAL